MLLRKTSPMNDSIDDPVPDNAKLIKLEAGVRSSVQFKPSKRMKKRRQLDALVGNDKKLSRRKPSAHELLRSNDSGSSEVEEFGIMHGHKQDKGWSSSSCCFTCYTLTCALLVTSCLLACATLIWMHLELKRDFNDLRDRLQLVENKNAATPEEVQTLQSKLNLIDKSLNDIRTGKHGLQSLNKSIVSMQQQIATLAAAQHQQQQSIQMSTANADDDGSLAKTVADLGSGLHSTQEDVKTVKNSQKTLTNQLGELTGRVTLLESKHGREGGVSQSDTESLRLMVTQINSTLSQSIAKAAADVNQQQSQVEELNQSTLSLRDQVNSVRQLAVSLNHSENLLQEALLSADPPGLTELQDKVNHLQQTLDQMQSGDLNMTDSLTNMSSSSPPPSDGVIQGLLKDHDDFEHFKSEMYMDISSLNATVASMKGTVGDLQKDMGGLSTRLNTAVGNITSITTAVGDLVSLVHSRNSATQGDDSNKNSQSGQNNEGDRTTKALVSSNIQAGQSSTTTSAQPAPGSKSGTPPS
ncbi:uncharacterized protein LOC143280478 [Babylonia areolata]|uniref:uncharacterized protein LOC143280478 n=1 Tax=Babylonia areolata TaxID=304850 RepID=UPI003FD0AD03